MPDPPGLFDGHVWPMYQKHTKIMEESGVDVCKYDIWGRLSSFERKPACRGASLSYCPYVFTVQLDGTMTKEQLFNLVYGDILNKIQKSF